MTGKRRAQRTSLWSRGSASSSPEPRPFGSAIVVAPAKTRREMRAERRRQRRRRLGGAGIAAIVVASVVVAAAIGFGVHKVTSDSGTTSRSQTTVLLSLQGTRGAAQVSMLLAHDSKADRGVEVLVPRRLITDVCGYGTQQFGDILGLPAGQGLAEGALSQLLGGVTLDGGWTLTASQLTALVNEVGGVTVNVDTDVITTSSGGARTLLLQKGAAQHLDGTHAVEFASYVGSGEDSTANLSRFQSVFEAMVDALPTNEARVARMLSSAGVRSSVATQRLAQLLTGLAADDKAKSLLPIDLPTQPIDAGGSQPAYRIDSTATGQLVDAQLAASLPAPARTHRSSVLVQNGVGRPGLVQSACSRLIAGGFAIAGSGNADQFGYATSQVVVFGSSVQSAQLGDRVARLLKLPNSDVVASGQGQNVADVIVILGRDYKG